MKCFINIGFYCLVLMAFVGSEQLCASSEMAVELETFEYPGLLLKQIKLRYNLETGNVQLSAETMVLQSQKLSLDSIQANCTLKNFPWADKLSCESGELTLINPVSGALTMSFDAAYQRSSGEFKGNVRGVFADGEFEILASGQTQGAVELALNLTKLDLSKVITLLAPDIQHFGISGQFSLDGTLRQNVKSPLQAELDLSVEQFAFDASEGRFAAADLSFESDLRIQVANTESKFDLIARPKSGALLLDTLYLEFTEEFQPELGFDGNFNGQQLSLDQGYYQDDGTLSIRFDSQFDLASQIPGSWFAQIKVESLAQTYSRYIKDVLFTLGAGEYEPEGQLAFGLNGDGFSLQHATANIERLTIKDLADRFSFSEVEGQIDYDADGDSLDSSLSWQNASFYRLPVGESALRFFIGGREFQLLSDWQLPFLDGRLNVAELSVSGTDVSELQVDFKADLEPVSLLAITESLGLLPLQGQLSGQIPRVSLRDGVLAVGGAINIEVFDGDVTLDALRLERVFGVLPNFSANVSFDNIELEQLTGAFSFGKIEGRLDGSMTDLRLLAWRPVAFDLQLKTPQGDRSRRKISQRAVENLSSIGGASAAVSKTFLGFFDNFSYRRIGLSCLLANNVCKMGGAGPGPNGSYYIVEGSGIPRINILGFANEVDFPQLLAKLKAAASSGEDIVID